MVQGRKCPDTHHFDADISSLYQAVDSKNNLLEMPLCVLVEVARHSSGLAAGTAFPAHRVRSAGDMENFSHRCDEQRLHQVDKGDLLSFI